MQVAEDYARPVCGELGHSFSRGNDFGESFQLRWGRLAFEMMHGVAANLKVLIRVYRADVCETYMVDTDPYDIHWNRHKRHTRDFFVLPDSARHGPVHCVRFSFIVHLGEHSLVSRNEYLLMDGAQVHDRQPQRRGITHDYASPNSYRTQELEAGELQRDVDWHNHHFESLNLTPKFTKGQPQHPFHPKRYIHDQIDRVVRQKWEDPGRPCAIKVSVDCIDDHDFINHLIYAHSQGVKVQCIVDWRKMTLTNSDNFARLKRCGIELIGVLCTPSHHLIEVEPDMHTKFIIFGDEDAILGSFNITFERWWANWESGMTFHSKGVCRLLDNIFQSQRGGVIRPYGVDPQSPFNLLYTFGRHTSLGGKPYRPHHAIMAEINRATRSIKICLFLIGNLVGECNDSVVDALIQAKNRGVHVQLLFNGHVARGGKIGTERSMQEELNRPLLPAIQRLKAAGIEVGLVYGQHDQRVPYSPIHSKYCVIDEHTVLEGSFNWYNTSVFSHDLLVVAAHPEVARPYLHEFDQIQRLLRVYR